MSTLLQTIENKADRMLEQFQMMSKEEFCEKNTALLMRYSKREVTTVAWLLGLIFTQPEEPPISKGEICKKIMQHYTNRFNLVLAIKRSLSYCNVRIKGLTTGPRCMENPEKFTKEECEKEGSRWLPVLFKPDSSVSGNYTWNSSFTQLETFYNEKVSELLQILEELEEGDEIITDETLSDMADRAKEIIDEMEGHCYREYKRILVIPTFTQSEQDLLQEREKIRLGEQQAREIALRKSRGLM
jgi:hypothetical protein